MRTTDVPFLREEQQMPEPSTPTAKPAAPKPAPPPDLARASESGDAGVHQLLAERATALANSDGPRVDAIDILLEALGVSAR